jgi:hypothetical protein
MPGLRIGNKLIKRIDGPVGLYCCTPKQRVLQSVKLPVFLLLGDQHFSSQHGCSDKRKCVSVADGSFFVQLDKVANHTNIKFDLVIEHYMDPQKIQKFIQMNANEFREAEQQECKQAPIEKPGIINTLVKCNLGCFTNQDCKTSSMFRWTFGDPRYTRYQVFQSAEPTYLEGLVHSLIDVLKPVSLRPRIKQNMSYKQQLQFMNDQAKQWVLAFDKWTNNRDLDAFDVLNTIEKMLLATLQPDATQLVQLLFSTQVYQHSMCMQSVSKQISNASRDTQDWWVHQWPVWVLQYAQLVSQQAQIPHFISKTNQAKLYIVKIFKIFKKFLENSQIQDSTRFFDKILKEDVFFRIVAMLTICMDIYILSKYLCSASDTGVVVCYMGLTHCENMSKFLSVTTGLYNVPVNINNIPYDTNGVDRVPAKSEHRCVEFQHTIDLQALIVGNQSLNN